MVVHLGLIHSIACSIQIDPSQHKILLTEPPLNPLKNRENLVQRMFEKYNFHACAVSIQAMLTLYAQVRFTSLVVYFVARSASTGLELAEASDETILLHIS